MLDCLYSIKDVKVGKFGTPFMASNDEEAKRIFNDLVLGSADSLIAKHPEDYDLYYVGVFDVITGIVGNSELNFLVNANHIISDYKRRLSNLVKEKDVESSSSSINA